MANWIRTLNISIDWELAKNNEITYKELATRIVNKLKRFKIEDDDEFLEVINEFELMDDDVSAEDFDCAMSYLYSWADASLDNEWNGKKNCWIKTF